MFINIGDIVNGCMLVQISSNEGKLIDLASGNRYSDTIIQLQKPLDMGKPLYGEISHILNSQYTEVIPQRMTLEKIVKQKPEKISFIRYLRPVGEGYPVGHLDAKRGVTLLIQLDYVQRVINFQYSICNGDNFSKKIGVEKAMKRAMDLNGYYQLSMPEEGIPEYGTVGYIMDEIELAFYKDPKSKLLNIPAKDIEQLFLSWISAA